MVILGGDNMTILKGREIVLSAVFPKSQFFLISVEEYYQYDPSTGKRTELVEGYRYELVETSRFMHIQLKVPKYPAIITADELDRRMEAGERVFVELEGAFLKPYFSMKTKQIEDSFGASRIYLCEDSEIELE